MAQPKLSRASWQHTSTACSLAPKPTPRRGRERRRRGGNNGRKGRVDSCLTRLLQLRTNRLGHFASADGGRVVAVGLEVVGDVLALFDDGRDGVLQAVGG